MAAGIGWLAQGGYMCRLRSVAGTGVVSLRSFQLQKSTVDHPLDGFRCMTLRRAVQQMPAVYHSEGSAIEAKLVHVYTTGSTGPAGRSPVGSFVSEILACLVDGREAAPDTTPSGPQ